METEKIAVAVDSGCDVPPYLIERYHIGVIPFKILFGGREYSDGVDITPDEICDLLPTEIPKTSLPSGETILAMLDGIKAQGYTHVFIVCTSSGLSGTINLIRLICDEYEGLISYVLDGKNISIGSGMLAIKAAMLVENGVSWAELCTAMRANVEKSKVFFCLDTLEYLYKGGRIGLVSALLGDALKLKPIITCNPEGVYCIAAKTLGRKHAIERMIKLALSYIEGCESPIIAIMNTRAERDAAMIKEVLSQRIKNLNIVAEGTISPALIVNTGPGLIGIGVMKA